MVLPVERWASICRFFLFFLSALTAQAVWYSNAYQYLHRARSRAAERASRGQYIKPYENIFGGLTRSGFCGNIITEAREGVTRCYRVLRSSRKSHPHMIWRNRKWCRNAAYCHLLSGQFSFCSPQKPELVKGVTSREVWVKIYFLTARECRVNKRKG